ncbi:MAG: hypothetical protein Q4P13_05955 [Psychrobacter sp.]|nr:hypothetical protein [Psychrobacter sp.]
MTLDRNKLLASIGSNLNDYPDIAERWRAGDPTVRAMIMSMVETVYWLSRDNDVNIIEPFIKSKDRTIIADAINKGIMPVATACQHLLTIENNSNATVTLSQGRQVDDGTGRQWRLMAAVTILAGQSKKVVAEQSDIKRIPLTIPVSEPFYSVTINATDGAYLAGIGVTNTTTGEAYKHTPKFMNAGQNEPVYTLHSEDLATITITFGDSSRAGKTVQAGEVYEIELTQSYGEVDPDSLRQAGLVNLYTADEAKLNLYFKKGEIVRMGADPLSVAQLRLLASFPSMYDRNAVFMGNFDFLIRWHFMQRFNYMAIWNENTQDKYYGPSLDNINHLNLTVVAKYNAEAPRLIEEIKLMVAKADSLLDGRVRVKAMENRPYQITINGRLAAVHDIEQVSTEIKELLLANYGKGSLAASHPNLDGFNLQEIATRMRATIKAFQDRISDFTVSGEDLSANPIKPHQWVYLDESSIVINLTRTAETGNSFWTM